MLEAENAILNALVALTKAIKGAKERVNRGLVDQATGEAVHGQIRAVVADGRLAKLDISPTIMRGAGMDLETLAVEVTRAVNDAIDDLGHQIAPATWTSDRWFHQSHRRGRDRA